MFGLLSGVQINWGKSSIFPLTDAMSRFPLDYPMAWCEDELKYLGIRVTRDRDELMRLNYGTAMVRIADNISKWITLLSPWRACVFGKDGYIISTIVYVS